MVKIDRSGGFMGLINNALKRFSCGTSVTFFWPKLAWYYALVLSHIADQQKVSLYTIQWQNVYGWARLKSITNTRQGNRRQQTSALLLNSHEYLLLVFIVEQNLVEISAVMLVVFYLRLTIWTTHHKAVMWTNDVIHKPEVHYVSQHHQRRTEPRLQATSIKCREVRPCGFRVMPADTQTNRQRDILIAILRSWYPSRGEVKV